MNPRPLIAHVVYRFDVGGLENGVVNLINRLPVDRYDHAVIALTEVTDFRQRITRERVSFHELQKPPGHGLTIYRKLYRLLRRLAPAIVHTRNIAAMEAQLPAALARVPIRIHGEHGWDVQDANGGKRSHHLQRRFFNPLVHRYVALSSEIRRYLEDRIAVSPSRIAQICNGVDTVRFAPRDRTSARAEAHRGPIAAYFPGDDVFVVGTVGRLAAVKHQRLLVDAFVRACRRAPEAAARMRLVIAGDGPDRGALEQQVAASGMSGRIWMTGARDDVPALLAGLDLFVLPSLAEGISNTILEAMACGVPVVATRVGGNAELVVDGSTGVLVASDDADAMADAIAGYAIDPDRADQQGDNARALAASRFSIDTMVAGYADLYDTLLEARWRPMVHAPGAAGGIASRAGHMRHRS
ncbi:MAG: TIGR03088 family PEP-CTERM/XrtA system glycosyltransferase [Burkholderiaceae bacterium]